MERASNTLLNILLGGVGGALALFVSLYDKAAAACLLAGTAATSAFLFGLAGLLVWGCLWARDFYPPAMNQKIFITRIREN